MAQVHCTDSTKTKMAEEFITLNECRHKRGQFFNSINSHPTDKKKIISRKVVYCPK